MITVGMNYVVKDGKQGAFEEKFDAVLKALRSAAGHVDSHMYRDVQNDCSYVIISEWSQQAAFAEFIRSEASRRSPAGARSRS